MYKRQAVSIRVGVADNRHAPSPALESLAEDGEASVRWAVAGNPSAPHGALSVLARDGDESVRQRVVNNAGTPAVLLLTLAEDEDSWTRYRARDMIVTRICKTLGVDAENTDAIDTLRDEEWWDMTPESPAVVVALALSPNA